MQQTKGHTVREATASVAGKAKYWKVELSEGDEIFLDYFFARCRAVREARQILQGDAARYLDVHPDLYKHYESRTPIPHRLIPQFCRFFKISSDWLFFGEGPNPIGVTTSEVHRIAAHKRAKRAALKNKIAARHRQRIPRERKRAEL